MPTGTTKVTIMGGGISLTPAGSQTFFSSGTWTAPSRINSISLSGRGGSGNPGTAGNPGNPGGGGNGGGGRGGVGGSGNPGNAGAAANPTTFNAATVVGGSCYPITVASGGQVNISWCPQ